jgi:hypothetical protein
MNERIRELAEQAGLITLESNGFDRTTITPAEKRFAELIVRECARKADQIENYVKTDNSCGDYLKKHFGVEE